MTTLKIQLEIPAPNQFYESPSRELTLHDWEIERLLQAARQQKYTQAYTIWYTQRLKMTAKPQPFSAEDIKEWFHQEAKQVLDRPFEEDEHNCQVLDLLCKYFAEDARFEENGYQLNKGLLLRGPVGCGKTSLLTVFARNPRFPYVVHPCREIVSSYSAVHGGGAEALSRYKSVVDIIHGQEYQYNYRTQAGACFDDLGTEDWQAKHFGKEMNVMEDIISSRDDAVVAGKMPRFATHMTTNLRFDDYKGEAGNLIPGIGSIYGPRCRSRIRGLFNIINFPDGAPDRRA
ncbi:ATP-binding protein [Hymenobacter sp. J193]|uniref:ATP-binding protein n=1 Tax=Hymenobacter sp. J193 TaxID=2898429 RepID=UPI002151BA41|nr:ATP-binding protein [Hymenobacter sp. J193]MCR5886695.1 ATP-binding protein [Hymenobacter sp. J193]